MNIKKFFLADFVDNTSCFEERRKHSKRRKTFSKKEKVAFMCGKSAEKSVKNTLAHQKSTLMQ